MEKIKSNSQLIFSASIFCLALAIGYFAYELYKFQTGFPVILKQMEKTSAVIYPTVNGIAEISKNIPPIADSIDKISALMPSVLKEVKATRESLPGILDRTDIVMDKVEASTKSLPAVLEEIRKTRELVPGVVDEIHDINKQIPVILEAVNGVRAQIPEAIQTVNKASDTISTFSTELDKVQQQIPAILEETRKTREAMPGMLDKAEKIVSQGQQFGSEASKGAVSGLIMGVVNPFNIGTRLKDLVLPGKQAPKLSDADLALIRETTLEAIENKTPGTSIKWNNPASKHYGKITVLREFLDNGVECVEIRAEIWIQKSWSKDEKTHDFNITLCHQPDGTWAEKGNPLLNK